MAAPEKRESYIPFTREQILEVCLKEGKLSAAQAENFRRFYEILCAHTHYRFHGLQESMKHCFAPFNPDLTIKAEKALSYAEEGRVSEQLTRNLRQALILANYQELSREEIQESFNAQALINLNTWVDFNDFEQLLVFIRHRHQTSKSITRLRFWKQEKTFDCFENVVVFFKFRNKKYFEEKKEKVAELSFLPGAIYAYLYKNIPVFDLEVLFPNLRTRMNLQDRLLLGIPALAAAGTLAVKSLSQFLVIAGAITFYLLGREAAKKNFGVEDFNTAQLWQLWGAFSALLIGFGGVAFRQFNSYRSRKLHFQKELTETLFFKHIATNASVFNAVIDAAEEEESKQMLLAYYHLITAKAAMTAPQLDAYIEAWFEKRFAMRLDFNMDRTLTCLESISAVPQGRVRAVSLLRRDKNGVCKALSLRKANEIIDRVWDALFDYANETPAS